MTLWLVAAVLVALIGAVAWLANRAQQREVERELISLRGGTRRLHKAFQWPRVCMYPGCGMEIKKRWQWRIHASAHGPEPAQWTAEVLGGHGDGTVDMLADGSQNGAERDAVES